MGTQRSGKGSPEKLAEYRRLVEQSKEELALKTAGHDGVWHLGECDWDLDQDAGTLTFTRPGAIQATCSVQIIGTYNTDDGTWLWAWDHPSVDPPLQGHAEQLRQYGEKHGIEALTTRKLECDDTEAWEFTALACKLCNAQGGYRGLAGPTLVFMTFSDVQLQAAPP